MGSEMKKDVWVAADAIMSPLGNSSSSNFLSIEKKRSGLRSISARVGGGSQIIAGKIDSIVDTETVTRFENICLEALTSITQSIQLPPDRTILILSTTKGNISELGRNKQNQRRLHLHEAANFLSAKTGIKDNIVVSNACISGVMAMIVAKRFLSRGRYDHAIVVGADELSDFVVSGFGSLQALSNEPCKPFDLKRKGINLGEAAGAVLLSSSPESIGLHPQLKVLGSGLTNDANHISGPSRTGEELSYAINQSMKESNLENQDINFISAHGTATIYNDEMEAKAFSLSGFSETPIHSLKGYYGHTLGAAGVIESIIGFESLKRNIIVSTYGFEESGVSKPLNIQKENAYKPIHRFLKTASGFGGCNAAIVFEKTY